MRRPAARRHRRGAQHEVAAEREADEHQSVRREVRLQAAHGADHLRQPAGVEQLAVQVVRVAVVAQVQAHHVIAVVEQPLPERQDVERVRAALPAVQQHGERAATARHGSAGGRRRMEGLQRDAVAAVEQQLAARRQQRPRRAARPSGDASAGWAAPTGDGGPAATRRVERGVDLRGHVPEGWTRISTRLLSRGGAVPVAGGRILRRRAADLGIGQAVVSPRPSATSMRTASPPCLRSSASVVAKATDSRRPCCPAPRRWLRPPVRT